MISSAHWLSIATVLARDNITHDSTLTRSQPSATEFTIGHNVRTKQDVDAVMAQVEGADPTSSSRHPRAPDILNG